MTEQAGRASGIAWERTNCPLCGNHDSVLHVTTEDYFCGLPGTFSFERCRSCQHVFLNPRPTPETTDLCYPQGYGPHRPEGDATPSEAGATAVRPWYARPPLRWIPGLRRLYHWLSDEGGHFVPAVQGNQPTALEIGCGNGAFLRHLLSRGWTIHGLEPVEAAARVGRSQGLDVTQGRIETALLPPDAFDVVFAWMVLEHVHDPRMMLAKVSQAIRPGGYFCFSVPNFACWEPKLFGKYWMGYDAPRHLHQFTPKRLESLLREAGFSDIRFRHQRNLRYVYGSIAARRLARRPGSPLGTRLMNWFADSPPLWFQLTMAPIAAVLAIIGQSGRMTIECRKHAPAQEREREQP